MKEPAFSQKPAQAGVSPSAQNDHSEGENRGDLSAAELKVLNAIDMDIVSTRNGLREDQPELVRAFDQLAKRGLIEEIRYFVISTQGAEVLDRANEDAARDVTLTPGENR